MKKIILTGYMGSGKSTIANFWQKTSEFLQRFGSNHRKRTQNDHQCNF
jgi:dephospho-CoA kinase